MRQAIPDRRIQERLTVTQRGNSPPSLTTSQVEPRVAIKIPKMRLKVPMKLLSIYGIEAQGCQLFRI